MKQALLDDLLASQSAGDPVAVATLLETGEQALVGLADARGGLPLDDITLSAIREAIANDRATTLETDAGRVFVHVFNPPMRLIVVGAVHIAEPLTRMAALAGYAVTVVDPRRAFTSRRRFEGIAVVGDWPDDALEAIGLDRRCALVSLAHDPKIDDPALTVALRSPAFYIGALGSRKTQTARLNRLRRAGFADADLARVHGPVGLAIGALTPAEIAISIMAEITQARRQGIATGDTE
jgi:xanthine dehydrogenase accessory factor